MLNTKKLASHCLALMFCFTIMRKEAKRNWNPFRFFVCIQPFKLAPCTPAVCSEPIFMKTWMQVWLQYDVRNLSVWEQQSLLPRIFKQSHADSNELWLPHHAKCLKEMLANQWRAVENGEGARHDRKLSFILGKKMIIYHKEINIYQIVWTSN